MPHHKAAFVAEHRANNVDDALQIRTQMNVQHGPPDEDEMISDFVIFQFRLELALFVKQHRVGFVESLRILIANITQWHSVDLSIAAQNLISRDLFPEEFGCLIHRRNELRAR